MQTESKYQLKIIDQELIDLIQQSNDTKLNNYITSGIHKFAINEEKARQKAHEQNSIALTHDVQPAMLSNGDNYLSDLMRLGCNAWKDSKLTSCKKVS